MMRCQRTFSGIRLYINIVQSVDMEKGEWLLRGEACWLTVVRVLASLPSPGDASTGTMISTSSLGVK